MEAMIALLTLTLMEIVLGIDNVIFITILTERLPESQQPLARRVGLIVAMGARLLLLGTVTFLIGLTKPWIVLTSLGVPASWLQAVSAEDWEHINELSGRDLILLLGGLFLIRHSVKEIHERLEGPGPQEVHVGGSRTLGGVLLNIIVMDLIFSLDSVLTAVGLSKDLWVMATAIVLSVGVMMVFAGRISQFVKRHPTLKMLALSFLILIGVMLVAEAVGTEINKGYIYFAMAFSLIVEALNIRTRSRPGTVHTPMQVTPHNAGSPAP